MTLSVALIRSMQPGATLWDDNVSGLHIRARATVKSWHVHYRTHAGKRRSPKLGDWPTLPLERARELARELLVKVAKGEDPSGERQAARAAPTMADLAEEWRTRKAPPVKKPRSFQEDLYNLKNHVEPRFGRMKLADVTPSVIRKELAEIAAARGRSAARATRTMLSGLFTLAGSSELLWVPKGHNPVSGEDVPTYKPAARRRKLEAHEFRRVAEELEALRAEYPYHVAAIWVSLLCGSRVTELVTAKCSELRGGAIVRAEHKTDADGRERIIELNSHARAEIERLPVSPSGYIFGPLGAMNDARLSPKADPNAPAVFDGARRSVFNVWEKARDAAGCPDLQLRDMRRTFASVAKSRGVGLTEIGEQLGHSQHQTTLGYAWLFDDRKRQIAEDVASTIVDLAAKPQIRPVAGVSEAADLLSHTTETPVSGAQAHRESER